MGNAQVLTSFEWNRVVFKRSPGEQNWAGWWGIHSAIQRSLGLGARRFTATLTNELHSSARIWTRRLYASDDAILDTTRQRKGATSHNVMWFVFLFVCFLTISYTKKIQSNFSQQFLFRKLKNTIKANGKYDCIHFLSQILSMPLEPTDVTLMAAKLTLATSLELARLSLWICQFGIWWSHRGENIFDARKKVSDHQMSNLLCEVLTLVNKTWQNSNLWGFAKSAYFEIKNA